MSQLHPATVVLFASALLIFWLTPVSAWWMLSGQRESNARIWFTGTALYALVATVYVFGRSVPGWLSGPVVAGITLASLLCMVESLRRELSSGRPPWRWYALAVVLDVSLLLWLYDQGWFGGLGIACHLVILSVLEIFLIGLVNRLRRRHRSKSLWLIMVMLAVFATSNLSRVGSLVLTGYFPVLLDFTVLGSVALVVNFVSVVFYCYGYWGFVVEKNRALEAAATALAVQAREGEKLALVGKLAQSEAMSASIAHELNQPLAAIQLNVEESQRIAQAAGAGEDVLTLLSRIARDNQRAAQIVTRVRAMFRREAPTLERLVPDELVTLVTTLSRKRLEGNQVRVRLSLNAAAPVDFASDELEHVLMNLIDNAIDSLSLVSPDKRELEIRTRIEPGQLCLSVSDSGPGVEASARSQIFDLLRTSKPQGMGVGLWLSRYIVERNGGTLHFEAQDPPGACFTVRLPIR